MTRRCIAPPAPANENGVDGLIERLRSRLHSQVPANETNANLTETYAEWSDYGNREMWVDLALRLKKSERSGSTGVGRKRRRTG